MSTPRLASLRRAAPALAALTAVSLVLAACSNAAPTGAPSGLLGASPFASASITPTDTPTPRPSVAPTPSYTNPPDPTLEGLIPSSAAGMRVAKPPSSDYGITPGDIGSAYGEIGNRFRALAVAYIEPRRLSLYAMRVDGDPVTTAQLRPYLATAAEYVGISGLHPEAWALRTIGARVVWVRAEDDATASGTMIYTWAAGRYVFLMIGTDDRVNRAMLAALPGEAPPSATPAPSRSPSSQPSASAAASN